MFLRRLIYYIVDFLFFNFFLLLLLWLLFYWLHCREQNDFLNVDVISKEHCKSVNSKTHPPVGGSPCSKAMMKFSSISLASSSPCAFAFI